MSKPCSMCGHDKSHHANGLGGCRSCMCSRYYKETRETRQVNAMRKAIAIAVDVLEEWPTDDEKHRSIRVGSPTYQQKQSLISELKKAAATI